MFMDNRRFRLSPSGRFWTVVDATAAVFKTVCGL